MPDQALMVEYRSYAGVDSVPPVRERSHIYQLDLLMKVLEALDSVRTTGSLN